MKKIIFSFLIIFFLFSNITIAQKNIVKNKYKTVKVKPIHPKNIIVKLKKLGETMFGLKVIGNGVSKWGDMYGSKENGKEKNISSMRAGQMEKNPEGYIWTEGYWKK